MWPDRVDAVNAALPVVSFRPLENSHIHGQNAFRGIHPSVELKAAFVMISLFSVWANKHAASW